MNAFLEDVACTGAPHASADVGHVADHCREPDQSAAVKDRHRTAHVVHMTAALPRIVGDEVVVGLQRVGGNLRRKCFTVSGRVPMNDGMLIVDWASDRPRSSVSTTAKSLASLTRVENEVRRKVAAASSTIEMRRAQWISNEIDRTGWRSGRSWQGDGHGEIVENADLGRPGNHEGRLAFLEDEGTGEGGAGRQGVALVHRRIEVPPLRRAIQGAVAGGATRRVTDSGFSLKIRLTSRDRPVSRQVTTSGLADGTRAP